MGEHIYLKRRNDRIKQLRFSDGDKIITIALKVSREFPVQPIGPSGVVKVLKSMKPPMVALEAFRNF